MEQAQQDVTKLAEETKQKVSQASTQALDDIKSIPPAVWGVGIGISLLLNVLFHLITKSKEDSAITAGVFVYALLVGTLSIFLRNQPLNGQFSIMLVILSVIRVIFDISAVSVLVLALCPFIVNLVAGELKARNIIPQ